MSGQLESNHYFRSGDIVRREDGRLGTVVEGWSLYATILWDSGEREEVEQFDPMISIVERARGG